MVHDDSSLTGCSVDDDGVDDDSSSALRHMMNRMDRNTLEVTICGEDGVEVICSPLLLQQQRRPSMLGFAPSMVSGQEAY